ncbi:MAG: hypothetical protein CMJ64_25900 [Planctomycetaceae bacterium]|nr:hypothetical protein [Planctomycetaceae bacterium]
MGSTAIVAALVALSTVWQTLSDVQIAKQDEAFEQWWGTEFSWTFSELPAQGSVPKYRLPYSGYIYPDTAGGTINALRKYDRAFNGRRYAAARHEAWDTTAFQEPVPRSGGLGLFGRRFGGGFRSPRMATPHWHGHCNGWAAATIRHAQPQQSVVRNGVTFTPADIKGLLAELYIYNEMNVLAGSDTYMSAATLHTIVTNWIGRGAHPIAMEADPGKEKWNYPIYAYATTSGRISDRQVEVKMNLAYAKDSRGEFQESPLYKSTKYFHYYLNVDEDDRITGGSFYRDSSRIDMLWIPLSPKASGQPGHERGNPYIRVNEILSLWRDSVPEETRKQWLVIDQPKADRVYDLADEIASLVPLQEFPIAAQAPAPSAEAEDAESEPSTDAVAEEATTETEAARADATDAEPSSDAEAAAETEATPSATGVGE